MTDFQIANEQQQMMMGPSLKEGEISTGTTILALPFDKGVIVCADSRTSTGTYVANRVSDKLVQLSEYIYCCRSGSAADTQALTDYVMYFLNQWRYVGIGVVWRFVAACLPPIRHGMYRQRRTQAASTGD
mmetsp:Transcript_45495/g.110694  ORF Transcript_45495/g.110694 Transcript_45495/m.110694 type:complete len:130 (-) Transcript_45495:908-1297(-)